LFEIDGSTKSGSGTILRIAVALAAIMQEPLHITRIRQNRSQPGLKPQHLEAVLTAAKLCNADLKGATLGSRELWFKPNEIIGGKIEAEIGTAGSIPMLLMTSLPICLFTKEPVELHVMKGGTDTTHAPTINYLRNVFLNALKNMGVNAGITIQKYGYYPKGMGEATLSVQPTQELHPFRIENFGKLKTVKGISICTFLADRKVAERQTKVASECLSHEGYSTNIQTINDRSNELQKGSSIAIWAETDTNAILGADAIGELRKPAEAVGKEAAARLITEINSKATVDTHLSDMLIPYMALSKGTSAFQTRIISEHLEANIWLTEKMLNVRFKINRVGDLYRVEKLAEA
jgi:RNA 3'-terminal phosphate cyclase (ATP)